MHVEESSAGGPALFEGLRHSTTFYLVRHGESEGNREARIQGKTDLPLTDLGREHARKAGAWLAAHPLDAVCASPLKRAAETARIICAEWQDRNTQSAALDITPLSCLEELETGIFSGKTYKELEEAHPELWKEFRTKSWEAVPGAERIPDLERRAVSAWQTMVARANQGASRILAVSHGGFIHWLIRTSFQTGWESWQPLIRITNCSISELRVEVLEPASACPDGKSRCLVEWRSIGHQPWA